MRDQARVKEAVIVIRLNVIVWADARFDIKSFLNIRSFLKEGIPVGKTEFEEILTFFFKIICKIFRPGIFNQKLIKIFILYTLFIF
jgi:hypothetical protein